MHIMRTVHDGRLALDAGLEVLSLDGYVELLGGRAERNGHAQLAVGEALGPGAPLGVSAVAGVWLLLAERVGGLLLVQRGLRSGLGRRARLIQLSERAAGRRLCGGAQAGFALLILLLSNRSSRSLACAARRARALRTRRGRSVSLGALWWTQGTAGGQCQARQAAAADGMPRVPAASLFASAVCRSNAANTASLARLLSAPPL